MQWIIPGTTLTGQREDAPGLQQQFDAMFLPGDMMLGQVAGITGLEPYAIQNWVRRGFLSPPLKKRYTLRQLCRIININMMKPVLSMERICQLLGYVNGELDDESDDMIDDSVLYFMFVQLAARAGELKTLNTREQILSQIMEGYQEPVPGAAKRVKDVLRIMLTSWIAAQVGAQADRMLTELMQNEQVKE